MTLVDMQRTALGWPQLQVASLAHPLAGLTESGLQAAVDVIMPRLRQLLGPKTP
jgi:hypothetical protein